MIRTAASSFVALSVAGFASLALAAPATAAVVPCPAGTYPPGVQCTTDVGVALGDQAPAPGESFHISVPAGTFLPNSDVTIQLHSVTLTLGTFTADSVGGLEADVTVPADFPTGAHTLTIGGLDASGAPLVLSQAITVPTAGGGTGAAGGGGSLPLTGAEVAVAALVGAGLVGAGGATLLAGRKRRGVVTA